MTARRGFRDWFRRRPDAIDERQPDLAVAAKGLRTRWAELRAAERVMIERGIGAEGSLAFEWDQLADDGEDLVRRTAVVKGLIRTPRWIHLRVDLAMIRLGVTTAVVAWRAIAVAEREVPEDAPTTEAEQRALIERRRETYAA